MLRDMDEADLSLFAHVVGRPDAHVDLAQAALMIAEGEYPGLDIPSYILALDRFAARPHGRPRRSAHRDRAARHLRRPRLPWQLGRLLRPAQQLPQRRARPAH